MRSRYCAYALGLVPYLIATTDPDGPHFRQEGEDWRAELEAYCKETSFLGLTILGSGDQGAGFSWVEFRATLKQHGRDASFTERSTFRQMEGRWYYSAGEPRQVG